MANTLKSKSRAATQPVLYVYGISAENPKTKITGSIHGNASVETLQDSGLTAWFSRVPESEFGQNLASKMEDLEWLAGASVRHQRTVSQISEVVTVLPARFGTVFTSEDSLLQHLQAERNKFSDALARIEGTEEWGVKLFLNPSPPASPIEAISGRDYLRAKAMVQVKKRTELDPDVIEFARELQAIAADSAPAGKVSSGQGNLEWQASFLVRKKDRPKWDNLLKRYATRWADRREIQCTGPWPPYSFV